MIHVTFLTPYPQLKDIIELVFADHPQSKKLDYTILLTKTGELPPLSYFPKTDVVISRGFTAQLLKLQASFLNVELKLTGYDVLIAATKSIQKFDAKRLAIVGTYSMIYGSDAIKEVFPHIEIISHTLEQMDSLEDVLRHLRSDDRCDVVLGGRAVCEFAQRLDFPSILLESGKESVSRAVDEAIRTVEVYRNEKRRTDRLEAILDYTAEGIVALDRDGRIQLLNQFARVLCCGSQPGEPLGKSLVDYFSDIPIGQVLKTGKPLLNEICMLGDALITVNCVPLLEHESLVECVLTFQQVTQIQELEDKIRKRLNPKGFVAKYTFMNILGKTPCLIKVKKLAAQFSKSDANILIQGETGSGKELFAQSIHNASRRCNGPFVAINCAALPDQLLESELFGYVEGAFTGAAKGGKMGLFELAHNGTIFLDEIGDIAAPLQARLLRVLQEREIIRLGHDRITPIDVRVIAATNKDLYQAVADGSFRSDLLYRLEVLKLMVPPLRDRLEDIPILTARFFDAEKKRRHTHVKTLAPSAMQVLCGHQWPGNVRELRNFCERLSVLTEHEVATVEDVNLALLPNAREFHISQGPQNGMSRPKGYENERDRILRLISQYNGSRKLTAAELGMDVSTLWRKMKKYGISINS